MNICEKCFESDVISKHIKSVGTKLTQCKECQLCHSKSLYRLDEFSLQHNIQAIIKKLYTHEYRHGLVGSAEMYGRKDGIKISSLVPTLKSLKQICEDLFEVEYDDNRFYELIKDYETDGESEFDDDPEDENWLNIGCDWEGSDSIGLDWNNFCQNVKHTARFFDHFQYSRTDELSKLQNTFKTLSENVSISLFRARNVKDNNELDEINKNPSKELGVAPLDKAGFNRFSPNGIPYIYLSEDISTAVTEIRATNNLVAIGVFEIQNLNLVNMRKDNLNNIYKNPFSSNFTAELYCSFQYIGQFLHEVTKEVKENDKYLDYIPTQIVSEYILSLGYDGFVFDSSLCDGINYVLFKNNYKYIRYQIGSSNND